jgi:hypothetical protein
VLQVVALSATVTARSWCWRARQRDTAGSAGRRAVGLPSEGRVTRAASVSVACTCWPMSTGVHQRPSKTGWVVTQFVTQTGHDHLQRTVRFSGECPGPRESATGHLNRPDDLLGHLGVQDRPQVSTAVVSTALATGLSIRRSDLPLPRRESRSRDHSVRRSEVTDSGMGGTLVVTRRILAARRNIVSKPLLDLRAFLHREERRVFVIRRRIDLADEGAEDAVPGERS